MNAMDRSLSALSSLALARQVADYAQSLGVSDAEHNSRVILNHLGAVLADCVLQAGLNYRSVVRARVERIIVSFPETATLVGTAELVERGAVADFLQWRHSEKIGRFVSLVRLLESHGVKDTDNLLTWLYEGECRDCLLALPGIGPKTVDYMCCLVGMDCIAVDRHVRVFVKDAGVELNGYDELKLVVSYAADLLDVSRRGFDSWIWNVTSRKNTRYAQGDFFDIQ